MTQDSPNPPPNGRLIAGVATAVFHGLGILLVAVILLVPFVTTETVTLYAEATGHMSFLSAGIKDIALHLGLSACLWALGFILYRLWSLRKRSAPKIVRAARGAVFLETLVVLVPFLLLTSGIAQLTILNITGVLAHLASYQATRTVWVWQPEADAGRRGVNNAQVERRARLAAAAIMAPSAPSDYRVINNGDAELRDLRGAMVGAFAPGILPNAGSLGRTAATGMLFTGSNADHKDITYTGAFDTGAFPMRAARKLTYSYIATEVKVTRGGTISTELSYKQNVVFPWFAYIWGDYSVVGGRPGYYTTLKRKFSLPAQVQL